MVIVKSIILMIIGFILLIRASDIFVDAVSSIATNFKMSKMMIALTVAAFGTCAPELAISFNSVSTGVGDIALANVLGSNIINILLICGTRGLDISTYWNKEHKLKILEFAMNKSKASRLYRRIRDILIIHMQDYGRF